MDIKKKNKGTFSILGTLSIIFICGFMIITLGLNNNIKELDEQRNKYLDTREQAREWVAQEVINYISVVDSSMWAINRESNNLDDYARNQIYGNNYDDFKLPKVTKYMLLDTQYTLSEDDFKVYVKIILNFEGDKNRETVFIATVRNNKITDMVVY